MFSPDFKEFIQSLNQQSVRYLVIGGYALAFHGHPRYTKDLDIWVDADSQNAEKLLNALADFGFKSLGLEISDFSEPGHVIQLGYPPQRIDILTSADGLEFEPTYAARISATLDGIPINFIDLESLKANKKATGRLQDLADLEKLGDS